jgi:hypothetical protein
MKYYGIEFGGVVRKDFRHYFSLYIFIVGPITFSLLLIGLSAFLYDLTKIKIFFRHYGLLLLLFFTGFIIQAFMAWEVLNISGSNGHPRYLLPLSPFSALIAGIGLNSILGIYKNRIILYLSLGIIMLVTLVFLSYNSDKTNLLNEREYLKLICILILSILIFIFIERKFSPKILIAGILTLGIGFTILSEKPIRKDEDYDKKILSDIFTNLERNNLLDRKIFCNQIYFSYLLFQKSGNENNINYTKSNLAKASAGSIFIYDYHYTFRPGYGGDTRLKDFTQNSDFKAITAYRFPDRIISFAVFEKINYFKD